MYVTKPINWPVKSTIYKWLRAYWFDDASLISPIRLCTTLFVDKTYKDEKNAMGTSARFVQLGFFGALRFGSNRIDIYSPSNGYQILSLRKVGINLPPYVPFSLGAIVTPETNIYRTNTNIQQRSYYDYNDYGNLNVEYNNIPNDVYYKSGGIEQNNYGYISDQETYISGMSSDNNCNDEVKNEICDSNKNFTKKNQHNNEYIRSLNNLKETEYGNLKEAEKNIRTNIYFI
ncbi:hypothetical protein FG386_003076 [Cryptosporidium ryanae]|uniref:uncharacterized protein n=1 Tax=Cryptosporidium ryanae TaxID=515981 RepID=UPI003519D9A1|nr:hypothetical protein FG386_003076 [Cryptosporidium ryanae]